MRIDNIMPIKDLSLAASRTIDGFMAGINKSKVKGPGLEFSQYRSYQPGDDLRWLDWKRYARSDRYYIRESEIETSISIRLFVDASNSMQHQDGSYTKMDYARYLAASLGYLAHNQGDSFGLYTVKDGQVHTLPSRKDPQHLHRFIFHLENLVPGGTVGVPTSYKHIFASEPRRELLLFITDMYEENGELSKLLDLLASLRHEIIVFHIMGRNELEMDYRGFHEVEDLETGERIPLDSLSTTDSYKQRLQAWLTTTRMQLLDKQIAYRLIRMDEPVDEALRDFLKQRLATTG